MGGANKGVKMVEDFKELYKQINEWKEQRGLTTQMQREGLIKNLKEEIIELIEAENLNEEIDALCDIFVFCIGALDLSLIKEKYLMDIAILKMAITILFCNTKN